MLTRNQTDRSFRTRIRAGQLMITPVRRPLPRARLFSTAVMMMLATMLPAVARAQAPAGSAGAQSGDTTSALAALVGQAISANPAIRAARQRVAAARAGIGPAGLRPDPVLTAGLLNYPIRGPGFQDEMTMKMVGIGQMIPYPGKLRLSRAAAAREADAAVASLSTATVQVVRDVKDAYYQLVFADRALAVVQRNEDVLGGFIKITEARYSVAMAGQQDILRAQVEASRLAETAATLTEQRRAALARLNAALDRPSSTRVDKPVIPPEIARAAIADSVGRISFASDALGARVANSPFPPLAQLQEMAVRQSPELQEQEAMIAAQGARVQLARKAYLPDFDVSLQYGQRNQRPDMVTAMVSIPLAINKGRKQEQLTAQSVAQLSSLEADRAARQNAIRAEVARLVSEMERERTQLALYVRAIIPQGRASLASATSSYQVGRVEFLTLLDNQATLYSYETEYFRVLTEFARNLAELERVTGKEIL